MSDQYDINECCDVTRKLLTVHFYVFLPVEAKQKKVIFSKNNYSGDSLEMRECESSFIHLPILLKRIHFTRYNVKTKKRTCTHCTLRKVYFLF